MNRIVKIGMDVHSTTYTLCAMEPVLDGEDRIFANIQVTPDYKNVLQFIPDDSYSIECGYEAGCLGYSLYNQLTSAGVKCIILAPTTMLTQQGKRVKTDKRDAVMIAQCLSYGGYHAVHVPTDKDDSVKEYLRMRAEEDQAANQCLLHPPRVFLPWHKMDDQASAVAAGACTRRPFPRGSGRISCFL